MADAFQDWSYLQSILDEVLYRDPSGNIRQLEMRDGATQMVEAITFADGSKLMLAAQAPLPPFDGMTPKKVSFIKLNGERGEKMDDGLGEAMELARQLTAIRILEKVALILDRMPECEKMTCQHAKVESAVPIVMVRAAPNAGVKALA